jgi:hypothetical protein
MSKDVIAIRELEYITKGETEKRKLAIKVFKPFELVEGQVSFPFSPGAAGCEVVFEGLETDYYNSVTYGADSLQAIQLTADVEPILKRINKKYELFFPTGEPYFE